MTPTEKKAREIYEMFLTSDDKLSIQLKLTGYTQVKRRAKQCALICVDEIIKSSPSAPILSDAGSFVNDIEESTEFYKEVKQHLNNL